MNKTVIDQVFSALPDISEQHAPTSAVYNLFKTLTDAEIQSLFSDKQAVQRTFGPFGEIAFPYRKMGAIDSLDLFGLDELILFSFYWVNRHRYKKTLDIGANIGLHSILMSRAGFTVQSYEPDSTHFQMLQENIALNAAKNVHLNNAAVSNRTGTAEFVRVLGNTTSSHLAGSKSAYGELDRYTVPVVDIREIIQGIDLMKMDVEGHEADILLALTKDHLKNLDILVEIGSEKNAELVFAHMKALGVHLYAQKTGWGKVETIGDMPTSYKDGTLFISYKTQIPWA